MSEYTYEGKELSIFANAGKWKAYWLDFISNYLKGHLLEVGAGIGGNTSMFARLHLHGITCLEPDSKLAEGLRKKLHADGLAEKCRVIIGNTGTMTDEKVYDTVVYIDVMEHIENDTEEMHRAACLLNSGGHLIVLSPAHNILYSPFDKAVGHFRRYNREMLAAIVPEELQPVRIAYLDSFGLLASGANRLLLKHSMPDLKQIQIWDRFLIPLSVLFDPLLRYRLGKTIIGIWRRTDRKTGG